MAGPGRPRCQRAAGSAEGQSGDRSAGCRAAEHLSYLSGPFEQRSLLHFTKQALGSTRGLPPVSCALCPPNYMSPSFKVTSKRVLELPLVCHLSTPREGRRFPLFPGLLVTGLCCPQAGGAGGRGEGKTYGKAETKSKRENHRFTSQQRDLPAGSAVGRGLCRSFGLPPGWAYGSEAGTLAAAP